MVTAVGNLVQTLIIMVMLTAILDMLLPQHRFRQYLRLVVGLLILMMVVNVFAGLLGREGSYASLMIPEEDLVSEEFLQEGEEAWEDNREVIIKEYRERLGTYLEEAMQAEGWTIVEANINIIEDYGSVDFGSIKEVELRVKPLDGEDSDDSVDRVKVPSITLEEENKQLEETKKGEPSTSLAESLATRLGISPGKVEVWTL